MYQATSVTELHQYLQHWKHHKQTVAFVPTMGNLHSGHLSLIEQGQSLCDRCVCSIFVNPMQFGPNEDWDHYPRTLERDLGLLQQIGCDLVYLPSAAELYPQGLQKVSQVEVTDLSENFEGAHRPGHFTGVATVVLKLFNIVKPNLSVFGKKDFQQYRVISKMVEDFNLEVKIIGHKTTRESNGLATSSRNQYLSDEEKQRAALIYQLLKLSAEALEQGERDYARVEASATSQLDSAGFKTDYFAVCQSQTLLPAKPQDRDLVILAAAELSRTRLIDNIEVSL